MFHGEFEHSLDAKRRLAIPSGFRDWLQEACPGDALIAAPGSNYTLWVWPARQFLKAVDELGRPEIAPEPEKAMLASMVFSQSARVDFDSVGRIRIPDRLLNDFKLESQVVIAGAGMYFELMTPEAWKAMRAALPTASEAFKAFRQAMDRNRRVQA